MREVKIEVGDTDLACGYTAPRALQSTVTI
jgi:hypothetical protein